MAVTRAPLMPMAEAEAEVLFITLLMRSHPQDIPLLSVMVGQPFPMPPTVGVILVRTLSLGL